MHFQFKCALKIKNPAQLDRKLTTKNQNNHNKTCLVAVVQDNPAKLEPE